MCFDISSLQLGKVIIEHLISCYKPGHSWWCI